ncbi:Fic family protein [Rhodospirillum sp. A1_3_36]|uniref:Fic family protein n=1 Tax=Rhodospirillum sp. A1_3_36 TaxID=3391666 RepID=UPI0039A64973
MPWSWEHQDWPVFTYDKTKLEALEARFQKQSGIVIGALKHVPADQKDDLVITLITSEAVKTSEIEGEILNRESVQASLRRNFGLGAPDRRITPAEQGVADMMAALYRTYDAPLCDAMLFDWHRMLMKGRNDLADIGGYRTHSEPMQVVSGPILAPKVHFEALPSDRIPEDMTRFIDWFNSSDALPPLTRAGIAHLYFETIHPFEDGNGRIGRAIAEKALSQSLGQQTLLALSHAIQSKKKAYYLNLEQHNKGLEITGWLEYFAATILEAQDYSVRLLDFLIAKTRLFDRLHGQINERQNKVLARMFREGPEGFTGGLSADKYISITGTTRPTATRDLADLVTKGALIRTGERRYTRYWLNLAQDNTTALT